MSQKLTQEQIEEVKQLCTKSLHFLCTQFLGYKDWDGVHDDLEKFLRRPARKKALLLPRGHLKSTFCTIAYSIQQIIKNPNVRILIGNGVWDISRTFLAEIKAQLESSQLKYLFGDFVSAKWNADDIIVRQRTKPLKEPTVKTTGVGAEQTGGHYDIIILDDLTGLQNSQTPDLRETTKRFRRSMVNLLEPGGLLIEIGTRWHLDDTFSVIFEKEAKYYDVMVRKVVENGKIIFPRHFSKRFDPVKKDWSANYDVFRKGQEIIGKINASGRDEAEVLARAKYGQDVSVAWNDDPSIPDYIEHLKASMPIDEFLAQYENNPISSENQLFKKDMYKYWKQRPEGIYVGMACDLAISQRTEADYTAIVVIGMDKEWNLYVLDYMRGHWTPAQIVDNVFDMQSRWKPFAVGMEVNGFQRTLKMAVEEEQRRRKQYFGIEEIRTGPEKSKENRIKSLEPFYRQMKVQHAAWMDGKEMEMELLTFPKGKHDDIIDAMSMCLPLLCPGVSVPQPDMQPGTYEYEVRAAQRYLNRGNGFFSHGR